MTTGGGLGLMQIVQLPCGGIRWKCASGWIHTSPRNPIRQVHVVVGQDMEDRGQTLPKSMEERLKRRQLRFK